MNLAPDNQFYIQTQQAIVALKRVIDPELFINIIDLGLVYDIDFSQPETIQIKMTLSTPHCPLGEAIKNGVENALHDDFPERKPIVTLVWEPAWGLEMMTDTAKKDLEI
jgi:metal-sulfur cluster biosynthetic enzyme